MFDVIHVLYEEDITPKWEQHIDVKDQVRKAIYPLLYQRPYLFATAKGQSENIPSEPDLPDFPAAGQESKEVKPYIPPTNPEDLMKVLDAPMGGL